MARFLSRKTSRHAGGGVVGLAAAWALLAQPYAQAETQTGQNVHQAVAFSVPAQLDTHLSQRRQALVEKACAEILAGGKAQ